MRTIVSEGNLAIQALSIVVSHHIREENQLHRQRFQEKLHTVFIKNDNKPRHFINILISLMPCGQSMA